MESAELEREWEKQARQNGDTDKHDQQKELVIESSRRWLEDAYQSGIKETRDPFRRSQELFNKIALKTDTDDESLPEEEQAVIFLMS